MTQGSSSVAQLGFGLPGPFERSGRGLNPGLIGSLALHLLALLVILFLLRSAPETRNSGPPIIPIDLVRLGEKTASPVEPLKALVPQAASPLTRKQDAASPTPDSIAPSKTKPAPLDDLQTKLRALARLRQPQSLPQIENDTGISNMTATSDGAASGFEATYSVRDLIRAQVERRWTLDLGKLGTRNFSIPIHIAFKRDGTVLEAEIVDKERSKTDAAYREVAMSARNAVLLSSPLTLPDGRYSEVMNMTLDLNPRDTLR
jgi:hypothetical protein